jgi:hypothetical protein
MSVEHHQANYLRTLESTNAKLTVLRERQTSVEVLREQRRGLEKSAGAQNQGCRAGGWQTET